MIDISLLIGGGIYTTLILIWMDYILIDQVWYNHYDKKGELKAWML